MLSKNTLLQKPILDDHCNINMIDSEKLFKEYPCNALLDDASVLHQLFVTFMLLKNTTDENKLVQTQTALKQLP